MLASSAVSITQTVYTHGETLERWDVGEKDVPGDTTLDQPVDRVLPSADNFLYGIAKSVHRWDVLVCEREMSRRSNVVLLVDKSIR